MMLNGQILRCSVVLSDDAVPVGCGDTIPLQTGILSPPGLKFSGFGMILSPSSVHFCFDARNWNP